MYMFFAFFHDQSKEVQARRFISVAVFVRPSHWISQGENGTSAESLTLLSIAISASVKHRKTHARFSNSPKTSIANSLFFVDELGIGLWKCVSAFFERLPGYR